MYCIFDLDNEFNIYVCIFIDIVCFYCNKRFQDGVERCRGGMYNKVVSG